MVWYRMGGIHNFLKFFLLSMIFGGFSAITNAFVLQLIARKFFLNKAWQWIAVGTSTPILAVAIIAVAPLALLLIFPLAFGPCMLVSFGGPLDLIMVSYGTSLALYYVDKSQPITVEIT